MMLAFITGEIELPPHHAALPDIAVMVDDIDRASRELHNGRVVRCISAAPGPDFRFVAHARLVGVIHVDEEWGALGGHCANARASKWFFGPYGLVLAEVKSTKFVPFKGALGFFDVPDDVVREAMS